MTHHRTKQNRKVRLPTGLFRRVLIFLCHVYRSMKNEQEVGPGGNGLAVGRLVLRGDGVATMVMVRSKRGVCGGGGTVVTGMQNRDGSVSFYPFFPFISNLNIFE